MLFAGLDVSTQGAKLVVIDLGVDARGVVYTDALNYDRDLPHYRTQDGVVPGLGPGVSESDPRMWIEAVQTLFARLRDSDVDVSAIRELAVSGQQHGLVALSKGGELTRERSKLWNDTSTSAECALLHERVGGPEQMVAEVGNTQRPGYTAAKIFHMARHEPEAFAATATFFLVHNYVNWFLTGGKPVMEPGDTSGMAMWHPERGEWSQAVLDAIAPELVERLPPVQPSDASIGTISSSLAGQFGFHKSLKIDAGSGDNMYGAIGTGNVEPGVVTVSLGTSGTAYSYMEEPFIDPAGEIAAFCDSTGHYLPLLCVSNLANGYDALRRRLDWSHEDFDASVQKTGAGNGGRVLIPWFTGERTPDLPEAAPLTFGFALSEFTPERLSRAVVEGHVLNLYEGFLKLPVSAKEIRLTGGLARSSAFRQTIADVFEAEVVPIEGEGAALGAAIHAAWVWLKEEGTPEALVSLSSEFVSPDEARRARPDPESRQAYQDLKKLFRSLSRRVRGLAIEDEPFDIRAKLRDV